MYIFPRTKRFFKSLLFCTLLLSEAFLLASNTAYPTIEQGDPSQKMKSWVYTQDVDERNFSQDSLQSFMEKAIYASKNGDVEGASVYAEKYVIYSGDTSFLDYGYFKEFEKDRRFILLRDKYSLSINWFNFFLLFSALIGFFIGIMLLLKNRKDRVSSLLISAFVLIHSLFIFHIFLYQTKLLYNVPHVLYMSSIFSYLYGPLIYLYIKRTSLNYKLKKIDILHLLPTAVIVVMMFPIFLLPAPEKLKVMFHVGIVDKEPYLIYISTTKFLSLLMYGFLILRLYIKNKRRFSISLEAQKWIRNLVVLTSFYVCFYLVYALIIINEIPRFNFLYNGQILAMASMVLYIGYTSYVRPSLFTGTFVNKKKKYQKSGLTPSFSLDLKLELLRLLEEEKIYRQNNISLAIVSEKLGTTRHNTSQVINEHFSLNFFELINTYRINEALEILKSDKQKDLNIIDIAYEVGFNNKVTFNKSFRKQLAVTPSQYLSSLNS